MWTLHFMHVCFCWCVSCCHVLFPSKKNITIYPPLTHFQSRARICTTQVTLTCLLQLACDWPAMWLLSSTLSKVWSPLTSASYSSETPTIPHSLHGVNAHLCCYMPPILIYKLIWLFRPDLHHYKIYKISPVNSRSWADLYMDC